MGKIGAVITALVLLLSGLLFMQSTAQAATLGTGYGDEKLSIGAFPSHGRQTYCMDLGAASPWGTIEPPELQTMLDALSRAQLAQLNNVMGRWGESRDLSITSAVAMFVWNVADHDVYLSRGGDGGLITRVPAAQQATVLADLAPMRDAAAASAVEDPSVSLSITMTDQFRGSLTVNANPSSATGVVTLTNATFSNETRTATLGTDTHPIVGTPDAGAPEYQVTATISADAVGSGAGVDLFYMPGS